MTTVWYRVRNLDAARVFYRERLGFAETFFDENDRWSRLAHGDMEIALAEGEPDPECGVAAIDVPDVKAAAQTLREAGVEVGTVLELHGQMRLVDVFDPDGNRIQLAQALD